MNMNLPVKLCFNLVLLLPFAILAQKFDPNKVLPQSLVKYNFGMSLADFLKKNKSATISTGSFSFRIEYKQQDPGKDIKEVTWYFDAENNEPLYEIIIEFNDAKSLNSHCSKKLGKPNAENEEWKWRTKEGYTFKAWRFSNTLVYALGLPSTEWVN